jgi:hypothetical protein
MAGGIQAHLCYVADEQPAILDTGQGLGSKDGQILIQAGAVLSCACRLAQLWLGLTATSTTTRSRYDMIQDACAGASHNQNLDFVRHG